MPRQPRAAPGGYVYHAINRAVARLPLLQKDGDYQAFERVLVEAMAKHPVRLLSYCLMPNHWHFVLWPRADHEMTNFLRWLTHTHTQRWHAHYHTAGTGHVYQGRNALRAGLVERAEQWRWSSLYHRHAGENDPIRPLLQDWPLPYPKDWLQRVNKAETEAELKAVRVAVDRSQPFGSETWQKRTGKKLNLAYTFRKPGRPKKNAIG